MFVAVGQVERALLGPRGLPGDRPGRDARRPRQVGRRTATRPTRSPRRWPRPSARRSVADRGPSCSRCRRTSSTSRSPTSPGRQCPPAGRARQRRRDPHGHRVPGLRRAAGHPRRRRRPARSDVDGAAPLRRAAPGPDHRGLATRRRHLERQPALSSGWPGFGAASTVQARLDAADALVVIGSRLNEATTFGYAMPRPGLPWAHVDLVPGEATGSTPPTISVATDAKAFLKAANERLLGQGRPGRGARRHAPGEQPRGPGGIRGGLGRRRDAVGRPGRPSRPDDRDAPPDPARRRDPDHGRRQFRELGRSWLPVPSSRHVPRPDLGSDGLRPAGGDRGRARPSRPAGRRARRRRRPRDDDGRDRDGRARRAPASSWSSSTTSATGRSGCGRSGAGPGSVSRASSDRSISRRSRGPAARAASASSATPISNRPSARRSSPIGRRSSRSPSTGVVVDRPDARPDARDVPPRPARGVGRRRSGRALRGVIARDGRVHPLHRWDRRR